MSSAENVTQTEHEIIFKVIFPDSRKAIINLLAKVCAQITG